MKRFEPGITVVVGPSGVGKQTIIHRLLERYPDLHVGTSLTTRAQRPNDEPGHYIYVDKDEFMRRNEAGELLEWAEYASNYYGSLMPDSTDTSLILELEYQGAAKVRAAIPTSRHIFIAPPGDTLDDQMRVLEQRLTGRGTDDPTAQNERLMTARRELEVGPGQADLVVVNDDIDETVETIAAAMFGHLDPA